MVTLASSFQTIRPAAVVFDVDGTLATGSGANLQSMMTAARRVLGRSADLDMAGDVPLLDRAPVAGWTDAGLLAHLARAAGRSIYDVRADLLAAYADAYRADLAAGASPGVLLPGVRDLLETLRANDVPVGLATGNAHQVAQAKLERLGIAEFFTFDLSAGFGDRLISRIDIGTAAIAALPPTKHVYLAGDTVADMESARANTARGVAVLSGAASAADLHAEGPWVVLPDVTGLARLLFLSEQRRAAA